MNSNEIITCQVSTATSAIMSNVTAVAKQFMINLFPKDYFKEIFITTTLSSNQEKENMDDAYVKKLPMLSISPGYLPGNNETSIGVVPVWRRGLTTFRQKRFNYSRIFNNSNDNLSLWTVPYRIKFSMDYKIKVNSHFEKIDVTQFLRQKMESGNKFFLNRNFMEVQIPNSIIKAVANIKEYNLDDDDDVIDLYDYLKQYSTGYINRKKNLATGKTNFYFTYVANILMSVEDGANSDGKTREKINFVDGDSTIDLAMTMELWIPNTFIFECKKLPPDDYNVYNLTDKVVLDYTFKMKPSETRNEKSEIAWSTFLTEVNVRTDEIGFKELLKSPYRQIIEDRLNAGDYEFINKVFEVVVYRDNIELKKDYDYRIDWKTLRATIIHPLFNYVYSIGIYANIRAINEIILNR